MPRKGAMLGQHVVGKRCRPGCIGLIAPGIDVARQRRDQCLAAGLPGALQGLGIHARAAVEDFRHAPHLGADADVTGTHLAQRPVHVPEHFVEHRLRQDLGARIGAAQPIEDEKRMQHDHIEAPIDGIGDAGGAVKPWLPCLRHNLPVEALERNRGGPSEQAKDHGAFALLTVDSAVGDRGKIGGQPAKGISS